MARLEIQDYDGEANYNGQNRQVKITLSRRNLLAMLHKLDMPDSKRRIENNVVYVDDKLSDDYMLVICTEDDDVHYADARRVGAVGLAGVMHPDTEAFIASN